MDWKNLWTSWSFQILIQIKLSQKKWSISSIISIFIDKRRLRILIVFAKELTLSSINQMSWCWGILGFIDRTYMKFEVSTWVGCGELCWYCVLGLKEKSCDVYHVNVKSSKPPCHFCILVIIWFALSLPFLQLFDIPNLPLNTHSITHKQFYRQCFIC